MKKLLLIIQLFIGQIIIMAQLLPYNQEFQVNTYTYADQSNYQIAILNSGTQVICWDSWEHLGSYRGVYAQMYDENGLKIGGEIHVNTYQAHEQIKPKISALTNGGFVICWQSYHQDSLGNGDLGWGLYAQIFDENGINVGQEIQVNTTTYGGQIFPEIVTLSFGGFAICWETFVASYNSDSGVFIQFFNSNGSRRGSELLVNTTQLEGYGIISPALTEITSGNVVVCWANHSNNNNINGIYAQILDQNGFKIGQEIKVTTDTVYDHWYPEITQLADGGFVIVSSSDSPNSNILVNKFDSLGNRMGEQSLIDIDYIDMNQQIAGLSDGRYIVTWQSFSYSMNSDIYAKLFEETGNKIGSTFRVNTYTTNSQKDPKISILLNGNFIISWTSEGWGNISQDGSGFGVFAQMYDLNGLKIGSEFRVNSYTDDNQRLPVISPLSEMGFIILWQSYGQDGSGYGIFGKYYLNEPIEHQLTEFNLLSPENNSTVLITNPQLKWEQASDIRICFPWEIQYDLYMSISETFTNPIIEIGIEDTIINSPELTPGINYYWKVVARNISGDSIWCSNIQQFYVDPNAVLDINEHNSQLLDKFILSQNYPNPFNPITKISWQVPVSGWQSLKVYDVLGNEVATIVNEFRNSGSYDIEFNASNLTSGVYFYRLQAGSFVKTKKLVLLK